MSNESDRAELSVMFLWTQFGPYHVDRCEAVAAARQRWSIVGLELESDSREHYLWNATPARGFVKRTLAATRPDTAAGRLRRVAHVVQTGVSVGARHNFLCHYERIEVFVLAVILRLLGRRVYAMADSKFDDRARTPWREALKRLFFVPYHGALVSGRRARAYVAFLGMARRPVVEGYDTVSIERVRSLADVAPAPGGTPFAERRFVVISRFVAKKNLPLAIAAYDLYRRRVGAAARDLVVVGSGPLEAALKADVCQRKLNGVTFTGFLQADGVARQLGKALALILPSFEEQWGLVVNEALALGVPVLCADNVGACDTLVRNSINGHVFAADDADVLAAHMERLAGDEPHWRALATGALERASAGDVSHFVEGVEALIAAAP